MRGMKTWATSVALACAVALVCLQPRCAFSDEGENPSSGWTPGSHSCVSLRLAFATSTPQHNGYVAAVYLPKGFVVTGAAMTASKNQYARSYHLLFGRSWLIPRGPSARWRFDWQVVRVGLRRDAQEYDQVAMNNALPDFRRYWGLEISTVHRSIYDLPFGFGLEIVVTGGLQFGLDYNSFYPLVRVALGLAR